MGWRVHDANGNLLIATVPSPLTEANLTLGDVTTNNVSSTRHGFVPKAPNDATKFLDGTGAYSAPAGAGEWTTSISKSADQDVANTAVPASDSELVISVTSGDYWLFELLLFFSGDSAATDYKAVFVFPTGSGVVTWEGPSTADVGTSTITAVLAAATTASINFGTDAAHTVRCARARLSMAFTATGSMQYKFSNSSGGTGVARTKALSLLRGRKMS